MQERERRQTLCEHKKVRKTTLFFHSRLLSHLLGGEPELLLDAESLRQHFDRHLGVGYFGPVKAHPRRRGHGAADVIVLDEVLVLLILVDPLIGDGVHAEKCLDLDEERRLARDRGATVRSVLSANMQYHHAVFSDLPW